MSRFAQIQAFQQEELPFVAAGYSPIINSLVMCLTPEEAVAALDMSFEGPSDLRRMVSRKIRTDMQNVLTDEHLGLINQMQGVLPSLRPPERAKCLTVLFEVTSALPSNTALNILTPLLTSEYKSVRKRILDWFRRNTDSPYSDVILRTWEKYRDFEAARLIADYAPLEAVTLVFDDLEADCLAAGWLLSRLYLRFGGDPPATLTRLRSTDAITYLYVCAKLGMRVPESELLSIYREFQTDDRSGLVIWCAGRMGAWDALIRITAVEKERWNLLSSQGGEEPLNR